MYVDGTCGAGGHTSALLSRDDRATVVGLDRDPEVCGSWLRVARPCMAYPPARGAPHASRCAAPPPQRVEWLTQHVKPQFGDRLTLIHANYGRLQRTLRDAGARRCMSSL